MARVVQQARVFTHKTTYASDFNPNTTERVKRVVPPASNPKASSRRTICLRDTAWWQYSCGRQELLFSHGLGQGVGPARTYNATLNSLSYADPRFVAACGLAGRSLAIPVHSFLFVARLPGKPQVDTVLWCGSKHNDFTGMLAGSAASYGCMLSRRVPPRSAASLQCRWMLHRVCKSLLTHARDGRPIATTYRIKRPIVCYTTRSRTCGRNRRLERSANTHRRARRLRAMLAVPCSTDLTAFVFVRGCVHGMFLGGRGNGDGLWMVCSSMINPSGRPSCASPYLSTSIMCSRSRLHENERLDRTRGRPTCNMRTRSRTHRRERRGARRNRS